MSTQLSKDNTSTQLSKSQVYAKTKPPQWVELNLNKPEEYYAIYAYHYLRSTDPEAIAKRCDTKYYNSFLNIISCSFVEKDRIDFSTLDGAYNSMAYEMIRQKRIPKPLLDGSYVFVSKYSIGDDKSLLLEITDTKAFTNVWEHIDLLTDKDTLCVEYL